MRAKIEEKLASLSPSHLEIIDESERHAGHAGYKEGGETHFKIIIATDDFIDKSRISRHRVIYDLLALEISQRIHALTIKAYTNQEYRDLNARDTK